LIYAGSAYAPGEDRTARDARCAKHGGQHLRYDRGADVAHFRAGGPRTDGGDIFLPIGCPDGPGPCAGIASVRPGEGQPFRRKRFELGAGRSGHLKLPLPGRNKPVRVRLRSLLGPGVADARTRVVHPLPG
jgi:hypothetical protein